jgi:hypothetical protein
MNINLILFVYLYRFAKKKRSRHTPPPVVDVLPDRRRLVAFDGPRETASPQIAELTYLIAPFARIES